MTDDARQLRADARLNETRVVEAAARAFARDGTGASLKGIARDAGVGIGTVYRRFASREELVWAVYRNEIDRLCATAPDLLRDATAETALRSWLTAFLDVLTATHGMADALRTALGVGHPEQFRTRTLITDALGELLDAGVREGMLRPGVEPLDVMMAVGGTALIAGEPDQREQAGRLLDLLVEGLKPRTGGPGRRRRSRV